MRRKKDGRGSAPQISPRTAYRTLCAVSLLLLLAAFSMQAHPQSLVMLFSDGPNTRVPVSFSFFNLTPFGYADFLPILTGLLTIAAAVLCAVRLLQSIRSIRAPVAALVCAAAAAAASIGRMLKFGGEYIAPLHYAISGCLALTTVLLAIACSRAKHGREAGIKSK